MGHRQNSAGNDRGDRACAVLAFIAALVLMVSCAVRNAHADVIWIEQTQQHMHARVGPWESTEREQALCEFLGVDWDSLSTQVKSDIRADNDGNNAFTALLGKTLNMQYEYYLENPSVGGDGALGDLVGKVQQSLYQTWCKMFGEDKLWDIDCTNQEYESAKTVIYKYMYPNDGSGGESGGNTVTVPSSFIMKRRSGNAGQTVLVNLSDGAKTALEQYVASRNIEEPLLFAKAQSGNKIITEISFYCLNSNNFNIEVSNGSEILYDTTGNKSWPRRTLTGTFTYNSVQSTFDITSVHTAGTTNSGDGYLSDAYTCLISAGEGTGGEPYEPTPDPEPQPPTPPTPPRGPTGTGDEYTHTDYDVDITVDFPEYNDYGGNLDLTWNIQFTANTGVGQNVEDILNLILEEIRDFRRDVYDYWFQLCENLEVIANTIQQTIDWQLGELQTALETVDTDIVTQLQENKRSINDTMSNRLQWLNDNIVTAINEGVGEILGEIYQDAMYIADSLNFSAEFDDKNIVSWLKRIYARLGSKPVIKNPTEDPKGWFDDLKKLLETILETAMAGVDTAALATLWNTAKSHFPLSLPWDMLAIVGLLAHEPITPSVDYPIVFNGETIAEIEFDLSDYEDVADISRKMSLIVFAMGLLITYPQIFHTLEPLTKALRG